MNRASTESKVPIKNNPLRGCFCSEIPSDNWAGQTQMIGYKYSRSWRERIG
jgi:hypothetical protein